MSKPYYIVLNFTHFTKTYTSLPLYTLHIPPHFNSLHFTYHFPTPVLGNTWFPLYFKISSLHLMLSYPSSCIYLIFLHFKIPSLHSTSFITFEILFLEILNFLLTSNSLHFISLITFLTLLLKVLGLERKVPIAFLGSFFQSWMVLFTKEYFLISILCLLFLIFQSWSVLLS